MGVLAKIHVENYGRIRDAEIELRPLTVFIGPNNTNKTWVAYAINGLVQLLSADPIRYHVNRATKPVPGFHSPDAIIGSCDATAKRITDGLFAGPKPGATSTILRRAELLEELHLDEEVEFSIDARCLADLLAVDEASLKDSRVTLKMERRDFLDGGLISRLEIRLEKPSGTLTFIPEGVEWNPSYAVLLRNRKGPQSETDAQEYVRAFSRLLAIGVFQGSFALPAERNGLISTYKFPVPSEAQGALNHASQDFVNLVKIADGRRLSGGGPCHEINRILERMVLGGVLSFGPEAEPSRMTYTVEGGPTVGIVAAASLVRSLAGFYCYFQHRALPQDLIIVDEPEMNAHPEAQLRLTEFFSALVQQQFRVLITTHSPYIVDHLNNLVAMWRVPVEKRKEIPIASSNALDRGVAAIDPEDVAVYLFEENGRVKDVFDREEEVIDLETFGKTSDDVSNLYSQILRLQAER